MCSYDYCDGFRRPVKRNLSACFSQRHLISSLPSFRPRSPMTTRSGMPIKSASLNFTPGALVAIVHQHVDARGRQFFV